MKCTYNNLTHCQTFIDKFKYCYIERTSIMFAKLYMYNYLLFLYRFVLFLHHSVALLSKISKKMVLHSLPEQSTDNCGLYKVIYNFWQIYVELRTSNVTPFAIQRYTCYFCNLLFYVLKFLF